VALDVGAAASERGREQEVAPDGGTLPRPRCGSVRGPASGQLRASSGDGAGSVPDAAMNVDQREVGPQLADRRGTVTGEVAASPVTGLHAAGCCGSLSIQVADRR